MNKIMMILTGVAAGFFWLALVHAEGKAVPKGKNNAARGAEQALSTNPRTEPVLIVDSLRQGNPDIRVFVQVVTTAERGTTVPDAEQVAAYARAVEDLVDAVRIYGASGERLGQIIERLRAPRVESSN